MTYSRRNDGHRRGALVRRSCQDKIIHVAVNIAFYFAVGGQIHHASRFGAHLSEIQAEWNDIHYKCYTLQPR